MSATKCLLSVMLVLVAAACAAHAQEKIKMCGRDLIRLTVSSCGNSRLRRSLLAEHSEQQQQQQFVSVGDQDSPTNESQAEEATLDAPEAEEAKHEGFSVAPHWYPVVSRIRRASKNISHICCENGCSMKELIQFC